MKSVYVIVLNYNGIKDTIKCIESLSEIEYENYKIVIIDNASTENDAGILKEIYPKIKLIQSSFNGGYAYGMNLGAKYAIEQGSDYILFLNNDTVVEKDFLIPMVELGNYSEEIGIITPKVLYMHDKKLIYCAGSNIDYFRCSGVNRFNKKENKNNVNKSVEISHAEGSCLLIKKEVFNKVGYLNENYFMYFEDLDFSYKVNKYFKIFFCHKSVIYHKAGAGIKWSSYSPLYNFYYTRNRFIFFSSFPIYIKLYVVIFSFISCIAKSISILFSISFPKGKEKKSQLFALWTGFTIGVKNFKK